MYQFRPQKSRKLADNNSLDRIDFAIFQLISASIPTSARIVLCVVIALIKLGYTGSSCSIGAFLKVLNRIGFPMSERTLYRSMAILEAQGYISRRKFRLGPNRFKCIIKFNEAALAYWTGHKTSKIAPINTHISPQLPIQQEEDLTKSNFGVNSCNSTNINKQPRAGARATNINSKQPKTKRRTDPILYTLLLLLKNAPKDVRRFAYDRARWELSAGEDLTSGHSGVPWEYWASRWTELPTDVRDRTMKHEILPLLTDRSAMSIPEPTHEFLCPLPPCAAVVTREPSPELNCGGSAQSDNTAATIQLDQEDLEILRAANLALEKKRAYG